MFYWILTGLRNEPQYVDLNNCHIFCANLYDGYRAVNVRKTAGIQSNEKTAFENRETKKQLRTEMIEKYLYLIAFLWFLNIMYIMELGVSHHLRHLSKDWTYSFELFDNQQGNIERCK